MNMNCRNSCRNSLFGTGGGAESFGSAEFGDKVHFAAALARGQCLTFGIGQRRSRRASRRCIHV